MPATSHASSPLVLNQTPQRILVTGATGFIGQLLVNTLLAEGHKLVVLTRRPALVERLFSNKVRAIAAMQDLPNDCAIDVVVNLAGARILGWRWTLARKKVLLASRVALTQSVVDWIARAQHKPRLLLSASAIGYYGIQPQGDTTGLVETSPPQTIFMSQLCQQWETQALRANDFGVAVKVMRFGVVLGRGGALPMMLLPIKLGMGSKLGTGKQWFSWIHVQDLLRAMAHIWQLALHDPDSPQIYNFTAPEVISQLEFSRQAAAILHRPCVMPTPAFAMRWLLGEQADLLLEGQRVIPHNLQTTGFAFAYPTLGSALANICK